MTKQQSTGLAAFTRKKIFDQPDGGGSVASDSSVAERARGKGDKVSLTVRLNRSDWERLHQLAVSEGVSIQALAVRGFSKVFSEKGLPGI